MENFPPNSHKARDAAKEPKRVERVPSITAKRRNKPLGKQFRETFFGGSARTAGEYMTFHVLIPAVKEMMVEAANAGFERLIYGESQGRRRGSQPPTSRVNYGQYSQPNPQRRDDRPPMPRQISRGSRARQSFDEIVIDSRQGAEEVLDRLYDILSKHDEVSVSDFYELTGFESSHTDRKWGWLDLRGAGVAHIRGGGYLLNLPEPVPLS